ncbi:SDR family NAD(P)-dependent oxidoreductase [Parerythrobacter jejuensis]|uniref:SDR family NAD(P)-dependent oxidoreductase n=2 Tax=Parerythrobacter jejuensis TaxID=795812 RepID=A0A845AMF8_9SPHN|nr:SDR family NAD(P)-dependent oxidoreductase [Parerythrobacter jejuensis]MXP30659.1 SDR family NAD(P)-dependent oxidoreductase [Parerythrobacter jejuensis]MXP33419.1 SDR family NAD(P)-dependent oxidoreductase [Parerythrobacter jejuensis]
MSEFDLPNASTDLSGKVALVTGASSGFGERFARVLASQGAAVALCARRVDRLESLSKEINDAGGRAIAVAMDATDAAALVAAVDAAEQAFGLVDILVNNAGIPDAQRAHKMELDLVDRVLGVNLRAPWLLSTEVARRLIAAKKPGTIVNISSTAHYRYDGGGAALYAVTKTGLARMTEALAVEWAYANINVNAICPGMFVTEMTDGMFARIGDQSENVVRQRIPVPPQLDSTLLYLVSPASECVTGAVIKVDDGQSARMQLR